MKKVTSVLMIALLAGCNSSSNDTDGKILPPNTHLPETEVPNKPQPQLPPSHLPDELLPERPTPDNWYTEVSERFGMTVADLHQACSFKGSHPQISVATACEWQNETLTITYYAEKETGDNDPGHSSTDFKHSYQWVVNDANIAAGKIWPQSNHLAKGLPDGDTHIEYGDVIYSLGFCEEEQCTEDDYKVITHPVSIIVNGKHIISDGTPLEGGETEFVIDSYRTVDRFFFYANFTHSNNGKEQDSLFMMEQAYPAIIYKVLSPAFGY
ncbi:hypothetical protein C9I98_00090 [Photobacterium sanctipauli]|uniref:Uncharacterized protein n=1 Tax=Photobacterium sanctipauli TaxID=1342794 RepID=A0A2T3NZJ9_9GAMM|nr:hypothetical protein [Photobacterium sanctipauli]PSW21706.1 hypothetical protein C9I98_00090 [Photobacterium sanctipauli]